MILFDTVEVIKVVDHHTDRLLQAFIAQIRRPVDGMQASAITQVKARNGVQRQMLSALSDKITRAERKRGFPARVGGVGAVHFGQ